MFGLLICHQLEGYERARRLSGVWTGGVRGLGNGFLITAWTAFWDG